jgi:hypothetical protein
MVVGVLKEKNKSLHWLELNTYNKENIGIYIPLLYAVLEIQRAYLLI